MYKPAHSKFLADPASGIVVIDSALSIADVDETVDSVDTNAVQILLESSDVGFDRELHNLENDLSLTPFHTDNTSTVEIVCLAEHTSVSKTA